MKKIIYSLLLRYVRFGLRLYFGKIELVGLDNLPKNSPFIITPNHQNAFLDPVLAGLMIPIDCHFLARADIFNRYTQWVLDLFKIAPVYRLRDGRELVAKNSEVFAGCTDIFRKGSQVLIFPEGNHQETRYLRPLAKGVARIAIQSHQDLDRELFIVPCGLNYFRHRVPRCKVIVTYGQPISISDFMKSGRDDRPKAIAELTQQIASGMKSCMLIPEDSEIYERQVEAVYSLENEGASFEDLKRISTSRLADVAPGGTARRSPFRTLIRNLFALPNLIPFGVLYLILSQFEDRVWWGSFKFAFMIFVMPIWLALVFGVGVTISGGWAGVFGVMISLVSLYVYAQLRKAEER